MKKLLILTLFLTPGIIQSSASSKSSNIQAAKKTFTGIEKIAGDLGDELIAWYNTKTFNDQDKKVFSDYLNAFIMRYSHKQRISLLKRQRKELVDKKAIEKDLNVQTTEFKRYENPTLLLIEKTSGTSQNFRATIEQLDTQFRNLITSYDQRVPEQYRDKVKLNALLKLQKYILNES